MANEPLLKHAKYPVYEWSCKECGHKVVLMEFGDNERKQAKMQCLCGQWMQWSLLSE